MLQGEFNFYTTITNQWKMVGTFGIILPKRLSNTVILLVHKWLRVGDVGAKIVMVHWSTRSTRWSTSWRWVHYLPEIDQACGNVMPPTFPFWKVQPWHWYQCLWLSWSSWLPCLGSRCQSIPPPPWTFGTAMRGRREGESMFMNCGTPPWVAVAMP